ncbi:hypothetical protein [Lacticaseibacillus camelliae]|uniref:hypothetical protein n=1 Tax=Lacticaseibacillus camelliae TaxID=381742 RepID=UPI0006CFC3F7|nr:hypothetical protein [Lacticaseibacillus camelliae]
MKRQLKIALSLLGALVAAGIGYGLWLQYRGSVSLLLDTTTRAENAIASLRDYGPLEVILFFGLLVLMCCIPAPRPLWSPFLPGSASATGRAFWSAPRDSPPAI